MKRIAVLAAAIIVLGATAPDAASKLEMEHRNLMGSRPVIEHSTILVGDNSLRIDRYPRSGAEPRSTLIFRGDIQTMFVVDHAEMQVVRLNQQTIREIAQQMDDLNRQLEEQLRQLPPEQRVMAEQMIRERGLVSAAEEARPPPEIVETSETETVAGYLCRNYRLREGNAVRVFCITEWTHLGLGRDTADTFKQLAEFSQGLVESMADSFPLAKVFEQRQLGALGELGGFPVATRKIRAGKTIHEEILTTVSEVRVGPGDFKPPAEYRETAMMPPE